jgi:hypothetical protein
MKTSTLISIARKIERALGVTMPGTAADVTAAIEAAAAGCRTKQEAARAIAEEVYRHRFDAEPNSLDDAILAA